MEVPVYSGFVGGPDSHEGRMVSGSQVLGPALARYCRDSAAPTTSGLAELAELADLCTCKKKRKKENVRFPISSDMMPRVRSIFAPPPPALLGHSGLTLSSPSHLDTSFKPLEL